jgi:hypothetical protein
MKKYYLKEDVEFERLEEFSFKKDIFQNFNVYRKNIPILNIDILINADNKNYNIVIIATDFGDTPNHDKRYFLDNDDRYKELLQDLIESNLIEEKEV